MVVQQDVLKAIAYFDGLSPADLDVVKRYVVEKTAERGQMIMLEGEAPAALYFLVSGAVKLFKTSAEGKEQILSIVRPGESFNEAPVADGNVNLSSAQAMGPVVYYEIKRNDVETIVRKYPQIASNTIRILSTRVRHITSLVEDLSFKNVIGRVAKILLDTVSDVSGPRPRLTQQEMAAMAGTSREVVGRSLKSLEENGAIRIDHHRIIIKDKSALEDMIGEL